MFRSSLLDLGWILMVVDQTHLCWHGWLLISHVKLMDLVVVNSDATSWLAGGWVATASGEQKVCCFRWYHGKSRRTEWLCLTHDGQMAFRRTTRGGHITWSCNVPFAGVPKMFWIFCSFKSGGHLPYIPLFHHHTFSYLSWFNQPTNQPTPRIWEHIMMQNGFDDVPLATTPPKTN